MTTTLGPNKGTEQLVGDAASHLDAELATLRKFVDLVKDIKESLGTAPRSDLMQFEHVRQQLAGDAATLATQRQRLQARIADSLGLPFEHATVRRLIESLPESLAAGLIERRQKLLDTHDVIGQLTRSNVLLLRQSMDLYQAILVNLTGGNATPTTYTATGQMHAKPLGNLVQRDC